MTKRRVVITGVGSITPLGNTVNDFWKNIMLGTSGSDFISRFDADRFKTKFACEVKSFENRKETKH